MNNHLTLKHEFRDYYYFDTGTKFQNHRLQISINFYSNKSFKKLDNLWIQIE